MNGTLGRTPFSNDVPWTLVGLIQHQRQQPALITNASADVGLKRSAVSIAMTMGLRINAASSLANSADTAAPGRTTQGPLLTSGIARYLVLHGFLGNRQKRTAI